MDWSWKNVLTVLILAIVFCGFCLCVKSCSVEMAKLKADCIKNAPVPMLCRDVTI